MSTSPEGNLCPVRHLWKFRRVSRTQGPVFVYDSGKFLTPQTVNKILRQASIATGVPENSQFSYHSLRMGVSTTMALDPESFCKLKLELPVGIDLTPLKRMGGVSCTQPTTWPVRFTN